MAGNKEIRNKIKSVQNTRKITKAMEMVAASKMRKAQERMRNSRPYSQKIKEMAANLMMSQNLQDYSHPFLQNREINKVGIIVISTDKGLCGALNTNVLRLLTTQLKKFTDDNIVIKLSTIGAKASQFANRINANLISSISNIGDVPHLNSLIGVIKAQLDEFEESKIDRLYIVYTKFINTMKQEAVFEQILPVYKNEVIKNNSAYNWEYIYEPDPTEVINVLLERYIESLIYQAVAENMASEQSSRMVAMKAASDNAKSVISELQLEYNKSRQASITKELSEIVSGAAAV